MRRVRARCLCVSSDLLLTRICRNEATSRWCFALANRFRSFCGVWRNWSTQVPTRECCSSARCVLLEYPFAHAFCDNRFPLAVPDRKTASPAAASASADEDAAVAAAVAATSDASAASDQALDDHENPLVVGDVAAADGHCTGSSRTRVIMTGG